MSHRFLSLALFIVLPALCLATPALPEESPENPEAALPAPFEVHTSVLSSTSQRTLLEIVIAPTEPRRLPTTRKVGLGLVAIAETGQVRASIVEIDASPLSDLDTVVRISPEAPADQMVQLGDPGIWRDLRVVDVSITPSWEGRRGAFSARRVIVIIENIGGPGINEKVRPVRPVSPIWDGIYRKHVLNYDSLDLPALERGTGKRYIVISRDLFAMQTPQFEEWKNRQGYGVEVKTLEDLGYSGSSITSTACLNATKNYILNAYNTWPETPEFVLLVGDMYSGNYDGSIWTEDFYNYFYSEGKRPHDQWYGFLEGGDLFADVMLGRLPDSNASRMDYFLAKTIGYEKEPYISGAWQKNALMTLATYHWDPDVNNHITATKNYVSDRLSAWGMNVTERFQSQAYPSQILPVINQGLTFYNYRGSYCGSTDWGGTFYDSDVQYVNNTNKLGVWTVLSCGSGEFDHSYAITAELMLRHGYPDADNPKGAVAFIGSQASTSYLFNDPLDKGFYLAWTDSGASSLGEAFLSAKIYAWNNSPGLTSDKRGSGMKEYTILGDPSLQVWTDVPTAIGVATNPSTVQVGQTTNVDVTVTSSTLAPVPGALVCLMKDSDVYVYGYTNGSGSVTLPVQPTSEGDIDLTVTGYNRIPHLGTMSAGGSVAPLKPEDVTAQVSGSSDLLLTWSSVTQDVTGSPITIDHYEVFRDIMAHFTLSGLTPIGSPTTNQFTDYGVIGDTATNYYYRIIAVSTEGGESVPSTPVGEFDFAAEQ